jgi:hypothetical protein
VLAVARRERDASTLVERTQPNPVFGVERLLTHRYEGLLFLPLRRAVRVLVRRRRVRTEPGALLGHDGTVARKEHQHERIEPRETRGVRRIPRRGYLIVDRGEEAVNGEVLRELRRVAVILRLVQDGVVCFCYNRRRGEGTYLHEILLRPVVVHASARRVAHELAEHVERLAWGDVRDAHVLRAKSDEIADWRVVVSFDVRAQELPA